MKIRYGFLFAAAAIVLSIFVKNTFEVDYYPLEYTTEKTFDMKSYFPDPSFSFTKFDDGPTFLGVSGACLIYAGPSNRDGNEDSVFELHYRSADYAILYLYNSRFFEKAPYFRAQWDHYVEMLKPAIGEKPRIGLILHIAASKACAASGVFPAEVFSERAK